MNDAKYELVRATFVSEVTQTFRRNGEVGPIELDARAFRLILHGPPLRYRPLGRLFDQWLRASGEEQAALLDQFGRRRFGSDVTTDRADLLTDLDIDQGSVHCCGDEDLMFLRCPTCRFVWIYCYECETWHIEPLKSDGRRISALEEEKCPHCGNILPEEIEALLPTRDEVTSAGLGRFLAT